MTDLSVDPTNTIDMDLDAGKNSARLMAALTTFRMRSSDRELAADLARMSAIAGAIDLAIQDMIAERTGLIVRVKAIVDPPQPVSKRRSWPGKSQSNLSAGEFVRAEQRLNALARQISGLESIKASVLENFSAAS
jgi:hypothetical protein